MVNPRVVVVGGGIAGLAIARALLQRGIDPDVVERAAAWSHPGTGMYLPANAVRALGRLGLQAALLDRARVITRQRFLDHRGRELLDVDLPAVWGATGPCAAISHRGLHELLRAGIPVRLGRTVTALEDQGPVVRADFDDGSTGDYDLVVGADGVRSWVRTVAFGGAAPRLLGQASWRFLVDGAGDSSAWTVRLGRGKAFLTIPVDDGRVYCYADVGTEAATGAAGGDPAGLAEQFGAFAEPAPTMLRNGLAGDPPYFAPIEEVAQRPWVRGRVVLVGDAAHAMSPNMAEGAGMALEDALVLAEVVAADRPLEAFEARRRPRVGFVQAQTHRRDRTRNLSPVVRNAVLRLAGQRIFRGNYHALLGEPEPEATGMAESGRERILAVDVVRGLAVVGMLLVNNAGIPAAMPQALRHAPWQGLTLADQVFPLFLFTVGASMPFSRRAQRSGAVLRRVVVLFLLGSLLVSAKQHRLAPSTGVLQQIAGAYLLAWLLLRLPRRAQLPAAGLLLAGLWAAFTFVPAPGVRPGSWAPGSNLAEFVDRLVLGRFSEHGVLVMVSSSVSVLAGVAAGRLLRGAPGAGVTRRVLALGAGMLALGLLVAVAVPIGKPLWTPSFVLVTAGISALVTAAAYRLVDRGPGRSWARPLVTLGSNALALYAASVLLFAFLLKPWQAAMVRPLAAAGGATFAALAYAAGTVLVAWALAEWLYWRRVFVKV